MNASFDLEVDAPLDMREHAELRINMPAATRAIRHANVRSAEQVSSALGRRNAGSYPVICCEAL
jgi:hypothetical protein